MGWRSSPDGSCSHGGRLETFDLTGDRQTSPRNRGPKACVQVEGRVEDDGNGLDRGHRELPRRHSRRPGRHRRPPSGRQQKRSPFSGVDRIEPLDDDRYRWVIKERRTLGISFIGNYVAKYRVENGTDVVWETLEGNMKTRGVWKTRGPDGRVHVEVTSTTELDAPVPRLMRKPAELFAVKETRDGLKAQFAGIKTTLERARSA